MPIDKFLPTWSLSLNKFAKLTVGRESCGRQAVTLMSFKLKNCSLWKRQSHNLACIPPTSKIYTPMIARIANLLSNLNDRNTLTSFPRASNSYPTCTIEVDTCAWLRRQSSKRTTLVNFTRCTSHLVRVKVIWPKKKMPSSTSSLQLLLIINVPGSSWLSS